VLVVQYTFTHKQYIEQLNRHKQYIERHNSLIRKIALSIAEVENNGTVTSSPLYVIFMECTRTLLLFMYSASDF